MHRERNPHRTAEETLESQTGLSQTGSKDEVKSTSASKASTASIAKPISILSGEKLTAPKRTPLSRASTRSGAESTSEDLRQSPLREHSGEDGPQLTEGPSRIVMASDGTKDCMALLLTERLITEFNTITEETRKLGIAEKELHEATFKANMAELTARELKAKLEKTEDPNSINDLSEKIETQNQTFVANTGQRESLAKLIAARRRNLEYTQDVFQNIFRRALENANLVNLPEVEIERPNPAEAARDQESSITASETEESVVSMEELLRRNAEDDLDYTRQNLADWRIAFDNRQVKYERALEEFHCALDEETTSCTQSLFDCQAVVSTQKLTRGLINAEADYESAVQRAKALGVLINAIDQESNFVSDISDGYPVSQEAYERPPVDRAIIEFWSESIVVPGPEELEELEEPQEPDDWDAKTIGISDSVSVVDHSRNRKRIDRWREMCGH